MNCKTLTLIFCFLNTILIAQNYASLSGQIIDHPNQLVRIYIGEEPHNFSECIVDSTLTDSLGFFLFDKINLQDITPVALFIGPELKSKFKFATKEESGTIWMDKASKVKVKGYKEFLYLIEVESDLSINKDLAIIRNSLAGAYVMAIKYRKDSYQLWQSKDTSQAVKKRMDELSNLLEKREHIMDKVIKNFIDEHPKSILALHSLYKEGKSSYTEPKIKGMEEAYKKIPIELLNNKYAKELKQRIEFEKAASVGNMAQDFTVFDKDLVLFL
jgi:hypothetical protein